MWQKFGALSHLQTGNAPAFSVAVFNPQRLHFLASESRSKNLDQLEKFRLQRISGRNFWAKSSRAPKKKPFKKLKYVWCTPPNFSDALAGFLGCTHEASRMHSGNFPPKFSDALPGCIRKNIGDTRYLVSPMFLRVHPSNALGKFLKKFSDALSKFSDALTKILGCTPENLRTKIPVTKVFR